MKTNALVTGLFLIAGLLGIASPAISEGAPLASEQTKKIEAMVDKAAALIDRKG